MGWCSMHASMGPRSDNRGYGLGQLFGIGPDTELQWVHGPITVGMIQPSIEISGVIQLQWVHGPITVGMGSSIEPKTRASHASMGPRSDNRGYGPTDIARTSRATCFNGSTVR